MEEKERFELFGKHCIKDNNPDARPQLLDAYVACVILNDQDKRIKELEEENGYIVFADGYDEKGNKIHKQLIVKYKDKFKELVEENKKLKQTEEQLAIDKLEKLRDFFLEPYRDEDMDTDFLITKDVGSVADYVLDKIKSLKGE